jgi:hypothetical protein
MTRVLTPVFSENTRQYQTHGKAEQEGVAVDKNETREYLADMLKELSAIAAWAELNRARDFIEAALHELEASEDRA